MRLLAVIALLFILPEIGLACTRGESLPPKIEADLCAVHALMGIDRPVQMTVNSKAPRFGAERGSDPQYEPDPYYVLQFDPERLPGDHWGVVATFAHEMAHLMQFRDLGGSVRGVHAFFGGILELELAADFTMGCVYDDLFAHAPMSHFEANFMMGSSFKDNHKDFHGRPHQRGSAFAYAVFGHSDLCTYDQDMHERFVHIVLPDLLREW